MARIKTSLFLDPDIVEKGKIIAKHEGKSFVTWVTTLMASASTIENLRVEQEMLGKSASANNVSRSLHTRNFKKTERVK